MPWIVEVVEEETDRVLRALACGEDAKRCEAVEAELIRTLNPAAFYTRVSYKEIPNVKK